MLCLMIGSFHVPMIIFLSYLSRPSEFKRKELMQCMVFFQELQGFSEIMEAQLKMLLRACSVALLALCKCWVASRTVLICLCCNGSALRLANS